MASSSCGKRASDEEWLKHKSNIERMFVEEKKSLVETRQRLENDGLLVTKAQLEYKLKLWGFRRRVPKTKSDAVWQFIGRRVQRRKQQGKETQVTFGKEIIDAAKVCKEIKRHHETTIARFSQPSPMTPEGLEIILNTPAPLPMRFIWPTGLSWSNFEDKFPFTFSAPGLLRNMSNISNDLRCRKEDLYFTNMRRVFAPEHAAGSSVAQLAAEIGSVMPETHENENFGRATRLLQGTADEQYSEYSKIILYKISNNFSSGDEILYTGWENVTEMLETSVEFSRDGLPFWHRPSHVLQSMSPTIFALGSKEALSLMLNDGFKPDRYTMRAAINDFDPDILKTLVKSPRLSYCPDLIQGPLSYAVARKRYDVVGFLLENGEDVNEDNYHVFGDDLEGARSPLQSAVENSHLYLIDLLLKYGSDVNTPATRRHGATALQLAAIGGRLGILRTLIDHGADINAPGAECGGRTALEGAAEHGRIDMIQYLLSIGARTTDRDRLQYLRAIRYAQIEAHEVAANFIRGHREWTTDDHCLWTALKGLCRRELGSFKEKTQDIPSSLNAMGDIIALKDNEVEHPSTKSGSDHLGSMEDVYDSTEGMEPLDDLQDLIMRTNDPMVFMMGEM